MLKSKEENPDGLHDRYYVAKRNGKVIEKVDPNAVYLVLRLDDGGDDKEWIKACREAALQLGIELMCGPLDKLGNDIYDLAYQLKNKE